MGGLSDALAELAQGFRDGRPIALARAISVVEDERPGFQELLHVLLAAGPRAWRVGFTGPPGAGKSTLVAALAKFYRDEDRKVGVVAVDPSSRFTGGALLGDRIRMNDLATDPGIFIRSMATRGSLGGLATTTLEVVDLMDAFGLPRVLLESVGVGQTELEITGATDTVIVVLVPESGDGIQAMKAGLMEIADIFVVNKADRPGADRLVREILTSIQLRAGRTLRDVPAHHGIDLAAAAARRRGRPTTSFAPEPADAATWSVPVVPTVARSGAGLSELLDLIGRHRAFLVASGELEERRRARAERRTRDVVEREMGRLIWSDEVVRSRLTEGLRRIADGDDTPYSIARSVLDAVYRGGTAPPATGC